MGRLSLLLILCVVTPLPTRGDVTLVRDGRPRAAIMLPAKPTPIEKLAAEELQWHIQRMSGAKRAFVRLMPQLFDEETLAPAERLLDAAERKVAAADPVFARRVRFLREGIRHVRRTREAVGAREALRGHRSPENRRKATAAAKALYEYRRSIEGSFVDWTEYSSAWEIRLGDCTYLRAASAE